MNKKKITIALVGTTNVGKSTLFNRLIGQRKSIIDENPHITRDRVYGITNWKEQEFIVIDTGGIEQKNEESFQKQIKTQVEIAILEADYIFWVVNNQINPTNDDLYIFSILNRQKKPILILANKIENSNNQINYEYYQFNYEILGISALHNIGIADVLEKVKQSINTKKQDFGTDKSFKIAIIGKTNVGKSSLLNSLTNSNRSIVSNIPNTTRDSISQVLKIEDKEFELIDTAGLNKKTKLFLSVEHYALLRAKKT
ncbi:MAG: GTP-binding protein, partial [Mycoplasma sp.]|nr:GTP-binding protein [Mycoplasma sp.]